MTKTRHDAARRCGPWLLGALCLHNLEEALTYGHYRERSGALVCELASHCAELPSAPVFIGMLIGVTALTGAVVIWIVRGSSTQAKRLAIYAFAGLLLLNVFLPHVPAAYLLGGYAPGVLSAVLINAPIAILTIRHLRQGGRSG